MKNEFNPIPHGVFPDINTHLGRADSTHPLQLSRAKYMDVKFVRLTLLYFLLRCVITFM